MADKMEVSQPLTSAADFDRESHSLSDVHIADDDVMIVSYSNGESSSEQIGLQIGDGNEMVVGAVGGCDSVNDRKADHYEGESSKSLNGGATVFTFVHDMASEAVRLASYRSWPHLAPVNPSALARAGLFYTGKDDVVECFSCHGQIKDWEYGDTAMGEHRSLFPHCEFVRGTDTKNDPLIKDGRQLAQLNSSTKDADEDDKQKGGSKEATSSGKKGKKKKKKKKKGNKKQNDDDDEDDDDDISSTFNVEDDPQFKEANRVLKSEYKRLLTFIYWPKNAHVLPEDCAKAGFYYCGSDDRVQCFCCYGILKNWRPGDSPMREHRKYFPSCPFVKGEDVGNEPMRLLSSRQSNLDDTPVKRPGVTEPNRVENFQSPYPQSGYPGGASNSHAQQRPQSQPRHQEYADENARLATYSHWPSTDIVSPKDLCRAGFYYTGIRDNVKCFFCDGGLRNWEPVDEPWIEHARWFPKCEYVVKERGSAFVKYVTTRFPSVPSNNPQANPARNPPRGAARPRANDFMKTDLVQVVLDMGYSKDLVKKVVQRRIKQTGESFRSTHDLLLAVFDVEAEISASGKTNADFLAEEEDDEDEEKANEGAAGESSKLNNELSSGLSTPEDLQRELETLRDQKTCKVCMDRDVCMLFQPCGHLVTCEVCSAALRQCPICRNNIRSTIRTYMS